MLEGLHPLSALLLCIWD